MCDKLVFYWEQTSARAMPWPNRADARTELARHRLHRMAATWYALCTGVNITDHLDGLATLGKGQKIHTDVLPSTPCGSTNPFPIGKCLDESLSQLWADLLPGDELLPNRCQTDARNDTALHLYELN